MKRLAHKGFTLTETVVVLALFTVLSFVVMESISSFYRLNAYTLEQAYQVNHARNGVKQLVRDLREMTFADDGTFPLVVMEDTEVGFYSDIDRDDSVEYVVYELLGTTLEKRIYNATGTPPTYSLSEPESIHTISEYVQNGIQGTPIFVYYDVTGNPATSGATITDIAYIGLSIIVNIDPIRNPGEYMLRSSASFRNLKN
jgi:prepilin-type N-terminal cleavage/methylation domain-containing protein